MLLYILYSNKEDGELLDVSVFPTFEDAESYAEPIDVVEGEYGGAYCTDGAIYAVGLDDRNHTKLTKIGHDLELVEGKMRRYLEFSGLLDTSLSIQENLERFVISGSPSDFFVDMFRTFFRWFKTRL